MAFNRSTGKLIWQDSVKPSVYLNIHPINSYASKTIASDGKRVYASFSSYGIMSYDLNGKRLWKYEHDPEIDFYGGSSSPIIYNDKVICVIGSDTDPRIVALDCITGDSIWTIRARDQDWGNFNLRSTPVIWKDQMVMHLSWNLVAYNLNTREISWWMPIPNSGSATPVIYRDTLFVNSWLHGGEAKTRPELLSFSELLNRYDLNGNKSIEQEELPDDKYYFERPESPDAPMSKRKLNDKDFFVMFDTNKNGAYDENEWLAIWKAMYPYMQDHGMYAISMEGSGERAQKEMFWKVNQNTPEVPSPLITGSDVFFIKSGGIVTAINRSVGEITFNERINSGGAFLSSPLLSADRIYTASYNGNVAVLSADDYSVIAINKLKEKIGASPVVIDNVLYIRTNKHLLAFRNDD